MATRIRSGRWIAVLAAACTATLAVVSTSGAATRSSGPMTYVTASGEAFANQSTALLSALCPEGSRATAAGASIEGTRKSRQIFEFNLIDNIDDGDEADNGVTVAASNMTNGTPTLKQTALCLRSDEDSLGYFGYSDSDDFASIGSYQTAQPFIPCVLGAEWAIGAGVGIEGPGEDVRVHSLYPDPEHDDWDAYLVKFPSAADERTYEVNSVCMNEGVRRLRYRSETQTGRDDERTVKVSCPDGFRVAGGGFQATNKFELFSPWESAPYDDGDSNRTPEDGWRVRAYKFDDATGEPLTAHAVCVGAAI